MLDQHETVLYYDPEHTTLEAPPGSGIALEILKRPTIDNILSLHIATTLFASSNVRPDAVEIASILSAYCAYLICYAPELITDNIYQAQLLLEGVQRRVRWYLQDCRSEDGMYTKMSRFEPNEEEDEYKAIVAKGVTLSKELSCDLPGEGERWGLLAQVWVKVLLSNVAPSNNVAAHVKRLASGGEFITHLWAFMTQGGFVKQPWVPCGN